MPVVHAAAAAPYHTIGTCWRRRLFLGVALLVVNVRAVASLATDGRAAPPPPLTPTKMWPHPGRTLSTRVVSYNVLSSHLAQPSHYCTYPVEHLDAAHRLPAVLRKLAEEIGRHPRTVFCLQEVSRDWAGPLHAFFANRQYHLATGLYGKPFNGHMGVCLAWPTREMEAVNVEMVRLSDTRPGGWPAPEPEPSCLNVVKTVQAWYRRLRNRGPPPEPWGDAERRANLVLAATLRDRDSNCTFVVATYHMPCAFYAPPIMTLHTDLAARYVQDLADREGGVPYILAGDFNIKPGDPQYLLLTTADPGVGLAGDVVPPPRGGFVWEPSLREPLRSAYAVHLTKEPDFTNYARTGEKEPFIDTLDYIFVSRQWTVNDVRKLPHRDEAKGPYPNLDVEEPSDHVLIAATLSLRN